MGVGFVAQHEVQHGGGAGEVLEGGDEAAGGVDCGELGCGFEERGFGGVEAIETQGCDGHLVDEVVLRLVAGLEGLDVAVEEGVELGAFFVAEDGFGGGETVFDTVHAGAGFSIFGDWAGGFCAVFAGEFEFS